MKLIVLCAALILLVIPSPAPAQIRELPLPAGTGSALPRLSAAPGGEILISWVEPRPRERHALLFATLGDSGWSDPRTVTEGEGWFVNWADFPSVVGLPEDALAAHWLEKSGPGTYAYDVRVSVSPDGGARWNAPVTPHRDRTETEHGFVSLYPEAGGRLGAVWLDGREMAGGDDHHGSGDMTLRYAALDRAGVVVDSAVLDHRVCECCKTSAATTGEGPVVVYRDRSDGEIRDIFIVRRSNGTWTSPQPVARDGWEIEGCPVNGPAVAARGAAVAVAWFTAAQDTPRVRIAFSADAGRTFGPPVRVDDGSPVGRVDVVLEQGGSALVSWLEGQGGEGAFRVRRVHPDGKAEVPITVASPETARSGGFPQMELSGGRLVFAWTGDRVFTAEMQLP